MTISPRRLAGFLFLAGCFLAASPVAAEKQQPAVCKLDDATQAKCLEILRAGVRSDEFWPSIHAAEGLTLAGQGDEVRQLLEPKLPSETDDQHRCGLARELVRAGDRPKAAIMLDILAGADDYGHVHACESLYKVNEIGDGRALRTALENTGNPRLALMAAGALARWGNPQAFALLRKQVHSEDSEIARIAAWILARVGDQQDIPALQAGGERFQEPLIQAYFGHALAALHAPGGVALLKKNLTNTDPAIRVFAATFAGDARATSLRDDLIARLDDQNLDVRLRAAQSLLVLSRPAPPQADEVVFRDVYRATAKNPRYSEGSIVQLSDGSLLYATTEFFNSASDFAAARIIARRSHDGGRTWSKPRVLQENVGGKNVMSATLRWLANPLRDDTPLGLFYLVKNSFSDLKAYLRISHDQGKTFGEPIVVTDAPGYHVLNNDRITQLANGRLLAPVAWTEDIHRVNHMVALCYLSDDGGLHWRRGKGQVDYSKRGAMEPEVLELNDGRLLMIIRTQSGYIASSYSDDGGENWSKARSWGVRAPEAPSTIRRIPSTGDLLLVWNDTYSAGAGHGGKRTPLTIAVSSDEGKTWRFKQNLETDQQSTYAYTSVAFAHGRVLFSYYVGENKTGRISSRFRSLPIARLYETP